MFNILIVISYRENFANRLNHPYCSFICHLLVFYLVSQPLLFFSPLATAIYTYNAETFVKTSLIHSYNTRAASCGKYHIQFSRLNQQQNSFFFFHALARKRGIVSHRKCVINQKWHLRNQFQSFIRSFRRRGGLY